MAKYNWFIIKKDYHERPEIDEVINKIKKIKEFIKTTNYKDLDNISLNILKKKTGNNEQSSKIKNLNNNNKNQQKIEKEKKINKDETNNRDYKVVFLGSPECAKTKLIHKIIYGEFNNQLLTIGVDYYTKDVKLKNGKIVKLELFDTSDQKRLTAISLSYVHIADCIVLVFSVANEDDLLEIKNSIYPLSKNHSNNKLMYLIGNKIDEKRKINKEEAMNFANENNLRYFEISSKTGEGIKIFYNDLINEIAKV